MDEGKLAEGKDTIILLSSARETQCVTQRQRIMQIGPILVTLDTAPLHLCREHDDKRALLLPHHRPEVGCCVRQGTLRCYVPVDDAQARHFHVDVTCVDVVPCS